MMEKRLWTAYDGALGGPDDKRSRGTSIEDLGTEDGLLEAEFYMEQRLVGWIIGRSGSTLKEVEQAYNVKITVDQSTKDDGYSKVKVSGQAAHVQQAAEHMNSSLARAVVGRNDGGESEAAIGPFLMDTPPGPGPDMYEELHIEQRFVGWLLGKGGTVVREIEMQSGCKVSLNQGTRSMGFTVAQLHGDVQQRAVARQLMEASLERARTTGTGGSMNPGEQDLQVEQRWVGWLLGKGGGLAREIEQESGARITIDQSTKSLGYSTVKIAGEATAVELAKARIAASLQKVGGAPLAVNSSSSSHVAAAAPLRGASGGGGGGGGGGGMQLRIDQQWVGWLLGRGGTVVKEIEAASGGAKVAINQDTKAQGFSVATISGTSQQVAAAFEQISDKLRRVNPSGDGVMPIQAQPAGNPLDALGGDLGGQGAEGIAQQLVASINRAQAQGLQGANLLRSALPLLEGLASALSAIELRIEQRWVGWLLGSGGKTIREIETETGAKITIDQSCKDMGFSTVKISGSSISIQLAQQRIQASLSMLSPAAGSAAVAAPAVAPDGLDALSKALAGQQGAESSAISEMQVEQKWVGWVLGKAGVVLKEIEVQSGAIIKIDQSTKELGYSTVRITGDEQQSATARQLIQDKISQAHPGGPRS